MQDDNASTPTTFDSIRWPLIVFCLLLGHMSIMLLAMTLANADPPTLVEGSPYAAAPHAEQSETSDKP